MNSATVVGYTFDGEFYCSPDCLPEGVTPNRDEVSAVFAGDEWEYFPVCGSCGGQCEDVTLCGEQDD